MRRIGLCFAAILLMTITSTANAAGKPYLAHTDVEIRVGADYLCGTCDAHRARTTVQLFADRLFPISNLPGGVFELGPYIKGALLDGGHVPQIAGGAVAGYRFGRYEVLVNVGLAYATEVIGSPGGPDSNQSRTTYDLGLFLRYVLNRYYFSIGYKHNSNGDDLGLNVFGAKEHNPGIDGVFLGLGVHF
ncbi:hypothetical protein [Nitrospira sp. Nam74]